MRQKTFFQEKKENLISKIKYNKLSSLSCTKFVRRVSDYSLSGTDKLQDKFPTQLKNFVETVTEQLKKTWKKSFFGK